MTEYSQASQWVPSGPKLDEKANVHRMLQKEFHPYAQSCIPGDSKSSLDQIHISMMKMNISVKRQILAVLKQEEEKEKRKSTININGTTNRAICMYCCSCTGSCRWREMEEERAEGSQHSKCRCSDYRFYDKSSNREQQFQEEVHDDCR